MTVRDFACKYGVPLNQMKSAMRLNPRNAKESSEVVSQDYNEYDMLCAATKYFLDDMRFCIERAQKDNMMVKHFSEICEEEEHG